MMMSPWSVSPVTAEGSHMTSSVFVRVCFIRKTLYVPEHDVIVDVVVIFIVQIQIYYLRRGNSFGPLLQT